MMYNKNPSSSLTLSSQIRSKLLVLSFSFIMIISGCSNPYSLPKEDAPIFDIDCNRLFGFQENADTNEMQPAFITYNTETIIHIAKSITHDQLPLHDDDPYTPFFNRYHPPTETKIIDPCLYCYAILPDLKQLNLSFNFITNLGNLFSDETTNTIESLNVNSNLISSLDYDGHASASSLKKLYVSNNLIDHIEGLSTIKQLEILDLSYNQIKKIETLKQLINLEQLNLAGNRISDIDAVAQLENLQYLNIRSNRIKKISDAFNHNWQNLIKLELNRNKIQHLDWLTINKKIPYLI